MASIPFPAKRVPAAVGKRILAGLEQAYPQAVTALEYRNAFELLVAVALSAQCTDARVNLTTPALFARYPDAAALAKAPLDEVERIIKSCGFFRAKARNIVAAAQALAERHGGEVPDDRAALESLPGVGRKTASVVLAVAFEHAAFAVDTHVFRVAHRLGLTTGKTPLDVEHDVTALLPREEWRHAHHWLILHGRQVCKAPIPLCERCPVAALCPTAPVVARLRTRGATRTAAGRSPGAEAAAASPRGSALAASKKASAAPGPARPGRKKAARTKPSGRGRS
ncbi:MAG: endonuclease III [bacterium]|nr:endonuclease III [bacterium]